MAKSISQEQSLADSPRYESDIPKQLLVHESRMSDLQSELDKLDQAIRQTQEEKALMLMQQHKLEASYAKLQDKLNQRNTQNETQVADLQEQFSSTESKLQQLSEDGSARISEIERKIDSVKKLAEQTDKNHAGKVQNAQKQLGNAQSARRSANKSNERHIQDLMRELEAVRKDAAAQASPLKARMAQIEQELQQTKKAASETISQQSQSHDERHQIQYDPKTQEKLSALSQTLRETKSKLENIESNRNERTTALEKQIVEAKKQGKPTSSATCFSM